MSLQSKLEQLPIVGKYFRKRFHNKILAKLTHKGRVNLSYTSKVYLMDKSTKEDVILEDGVTMQGKLASQNHGKIRMGKHSKIGAGATIQCVDEVVIGDYTAIAINTYICDNNTHPINPDFRLYMRTQSETDDSRMWRHSDHAPVHIGKNCWIGQNVRIQKGVTIGDNSIIAANSIVTKSVPANCIAAGNPAKIVKTDIDKIPAPTSCDGYNRYKIQQ